jgi:hypothetical protein
MVYTTSVLDVTFNSALVVKATQSPSKSLSMIVYVHNSVILDYEAFVLFSFINCLLTIIIKSITNNPALVIFSFNNKNAIILN